MFSYWRRYGEINRETKPVWCTWSPTRGPNTSKSASFKCTLLGPYTKQVLSKPTEEKNKGVGKPCQRKQRLPSPPLNLFFSQFISVYRVLHPPFSFRVSLSGRAISSRSISCCRSEPEEELSPERGGKAMSGGLCLETNTPSKMENT